jgi:ribonuclease HI
VVFFFLFEYNLLMIIVYCDGACSGNPGPGAWAYVAYKNGVIIAQACGSVLDTTNNKMELQAAIHALYAFDQCVVVVDSQYVKQGITEWIHKWEKNGWKTAQGAVKNQDLWQELKVLNEKKQIQWQWEKGHAGNAHDVVDILARSFV